jgi:hypothetical protein
MNYEQKYLKYKQKYLELKAKLDGGLSVDTISSSNNNEKKYYHSFCNVGCYADELSEIFRS